MGKRGSAGHLCYSVTFSHKANVYCQHNLFCSCNQSLKLGPQQRGSAEIGRDRHVGICRYMSVQCRYMSVSRRYKSVSCRYVSVYVGIMSVYVGKCRSPVLGGPPFPFSDIFYQLLAFFFGTLASINMFLQFSTFCPFKKKIILDPAKRKVL